ncbi:hypothetical protein U0070_021609 [Myodes glareolus]|uniref:HAUS augmin-like complex subunit 1 n=1 Tax=Myodes glareolus TaxID=447135 RepID=A0AAW0I0T0_MYOGA
MATPEERELQVAAWLKKIFGDHPIPQYEVNPRTTEILYHLSERNRVRDRDICLVIEDLKQKANEYESEVNDLTSDLFHTKSKSEEINLELGKLGKNLTATLVLEKCLREDLKKAELHLSAERAKVDSRLQNMDFLKAKAAEFRFGIKAAQEQLLARGMDMSLSHRSLVALSEKLMELKQQTLPLKKKLESYLDLMPNPSLAQVKIEEAKRELDAIEAELTKKVDMMEL